jgi:hypothetical protein
VSGSGVDTAALEAALDLICRDSLEAPLAEVMHWPRGESVGDSFQVLGAALPALLAIARAARGLDAYIVRNHPPLSPQMQKCVDALRAALDGVTDEAKP